MSNASRDQNNIPTLLGVSSADYKTPTTVAVNPTTHRLLTDAGSGVTGPGSSTNGDIAVFDGTTGQVIKDSGVALGVSGSFTTANSKTVTVVSGIITSIV